MPYLPDHKRFELADGRPAETPGELNYAISVLLDRYIANNGLSYDSIAACMSACQGASQEFYARVARPYEDLKRAEHGEVFCRAIDALGRI